MRNPSKEKRRFPQLLIEAIDEGLTALGEQTMNVVYHHLERDFGVGREEIPWRLEEFDAGLRNLFGVGADLIETYAIRNLYRRLDEDFEAVENKNFHDYIQDAKRIFKEKSQRLKDK